MAGSPWKDLIAAVEAFISKRIDFCAKGGVPAKDLVTIINHNSNPEVMCSGLAITANPESKTRFRSGGNDFSACLKKCIELIAQIDFTYFTPVLLFMSDGGCDNGEKEVVELHIRFPTLKVFTIGFGGGCDKNKLANMANLAGGEYHFGTDGAELKKAFETISTKISTTKFAMKKS